MFLIFVLYNVLAAVIILAKLTVQASGPFFANFLRLVCAAPVALLMHHLRFKTSILIPRKDIGYVILLGLVQGYWYLGWVLWATHQVNAGKVALLLSFSPFVAAIFSYLFLNEHLTSPKLLGILIGCCAFIPLVFFDDLGDQTPASSWWQAVSLGEAVILLGCFALVLGAILFRVLTKDRGCSWYVVSGWSMLIGSIPSLITSLILESWQPVPIYSSQFYVVFPLFAFLSGVVYINLYAYLLSRYTATLVTLLFFITPTMTAIGSWIIFGETVSWAFVAAIVASSCGFYLFYREEKRQGYV